MILSYLKYIDIFGTTFQFTTFKNLKFQTLIGGIMTILSGIVLIVFCFLFGRNFLFKKNPLVMSQDMVPDDYKPPLKITAENLVLPWRLADSNNFPVDFENKFYPIITYFRYETNSSGVFEIYNSNIEFSKCTNETAMMPEFSSRYNISQYYCMDWSKDNYTIGGYWDGSYVDYFQLYLHYCKDGKKFGEEGANCTDLETVKSAFDGGNLFFDIMAPEYYFSPEDIQNPLKISFSDYFYGFNFNMIKTDRIYFKHVDLEDDQGWILEDPQLKHVFAKSEIKSDFSYFDEKDFGKPGVSSMFYTMNFYTQRNYDKIKRSYMKFQDFAAVLGGFMKIVLVFGGILSLLTTNIIRDQKIYNELFEFRKINYPMTKENNRVIQQIKKVSTNMISKPQSEQDQESGSPTSKKSF
jgi:hypothetical protein